MAEFQGPVKNLDHIRDYTRQFYVYGFKVRNDFNEKSAKTYDNERRCTESQLSRYTKSDYTSKGKHVYINVDSKTIPQNPLYAAWKPKSFIDNDLVLHFFILGLLWDCSESMSFNTMTDFISHNYGVVSDTQTVRLKLKEYEILGVLVSHKDGKTLPYALAPLVPMKTEPQCVNSGDMEPDGTEEGKQNLWRCLVIAMKYFQKAAPFGCIGGVILDRQDKCNDLFQFKHHFIVHTLEDGILADIPTAIREKHTVRFGNKSSRSGQVSTLSGVSPKIFISTQTGCRYLCLYLPECRRLSNSRLDSITRIALPKLCASYEEVFRDLEKNKEKCWGASFGNGTSRMEEVRTKLYIDEEKEPHILNHLYREGRGGEITKIRENQFLYTGTFFDTNEMLSWVKTFIGRIMGIQGTDILSIARIIRDQEKTYEMYCGNKEQDVMELFHRIYNRYYNVVRHILDEAGHSPITRQDMEDICHAYGFQESALSIIPKLTDSTWVLLEEQDKYTFTSRLGRAVPALPPMNLQKTWLKSLIRDPRFQLFFADRQLELPAGEQDGLPSFYHEDDFYYYDRYRDGDSYGSPSYRKHFQAILEAIWEERVLLVAYEGKHGRVHSFETVPYQLQYSSKNDKFRLCCLQLHRSTFSRSTIPNLARIRDCHVTSKSCPPDLESRCFEPIQKTSEPVVFKISGERNSLGRCMLHPANYEKHAEYDAEMKCWICSIHYDLADETKLLIDILSFGPVIRVVGPSPFVRQTHKRVKRQHELFYSEITWGTPGDRRGHSNASCLSAPRPSISFPNASSPAPSAQHRTGLRSAQRYAPYKNRKKRDK